MKRLGLFLGVEASAGGMFQYAQTILESLAALPSTEYRIDVAYASHVWQPVLSGYPFAATKLRHGDWGLRFAHTLMAAQIPAAMGRRISFSFNPIARQLRRMSCDMWIFPAQDAIAYQLPLPSVVSVHDLMHRYERRFPEVGGGYRFHIREHRFRNLALWAEGILVDSEIGRAQVVESYGVDAEKVYSLPYVPAPNVYRDRGNQSVKSAYGLPAKFLFYPAQFWAHKNHESLISAAASVRSECPDIHLVFTGAKRHRYEHIRAHAASLGMMNHITYLGHVPDDDLCGLYRSARALIMPTFLGPTNIPPLEALACDCPVAVSGIYAMPEQLGNAALYFDPRSVTAMADVLKRLWLDDALCRSLVERGRQKIASWNQEQFNQRLREILKRIDSRSRTPVA